MTWREITRRRLARLTTRIAAALGSYGPCAVCGRCHDPRDHYGLHDDTYDNPEAPR